MTIYNSMEQLHCAEFPGKRLGVTVRGPYTAYDGREIVDVHYCCVSVTSAGYGSKKPLEEWRGQAIAATESIIASINEALAELEEHKARLEAELALLRRIGND